MDCRAKPDNGAAPCAGIMLRSWLELNTCSFGVPSLCRAALLAQFEFLHLAAFSTRQVGDEINKAGNGEIRQPALAIADEFGTIDRGAGFHHYSVLASLQELDRRKPSNRAKQQQSRWPFTGSSHIELRRRAPS